MEKYRGPRPFDPTRDKPIKINESDLMTERLISVDAPDGGTWAIPTVWFNSSGEHMEFDVKTAVIAAERYEQSTGKKFPRFTSVAKAEAFIRDRSSKGGASKQSILRAGR